MRTGSHGDDLEVVMRIVLGAVIAIGLALGLAATQMAAQTATPYKLGMFEHGGHRFVGMVIQNDTLVVDLSRTVPGDSGSGRAALNTPGTLREMIARWDANTSTRMAALAAAAAAKPPSFSWKVSEVKTLPPITDPKVLLSTAVNYTEHALEMTGNSNTAASAAAV